MNTAKLRALFSKNRVALGALGVLAVVALGWRARSEKTTDAAADDITQPAGTSATPSYYTAGSYDSSATDLAAAAQELRNIASLIPLPGDEQASTPTYANGFYQGAGDSAVWKYDDGNLDFLTFAEYQALGSPGYTQVSRDDPFWSSAKVLDADRTVPWAKK